MFLILILTGLCISATMRNLAEISNANFIHGELVGSWSVYGANSIVCKHSHLTAHQIFSTEDMLVPVIRYLQNGFESSDTNKLSQKASDVTGSPSCGSHSCKQLKIFHFKTYLLHSMTFFDISQHFLTFLCYNLLWWHQCKMNLIFTIFSEVFKTDM